MLLERIYDDDLSQASYFLGCQASGEALVVDPRRDIQVYLDLAAKNGMRITAVTETHIHADFLSGTRELSAATGARAYVSGEGGDEWQYGFEAERLFEGSTITLGNITVTARHTPGHTPEHLSYLVTDTAFSKEPGYYLTGDFVFAGDLGRPDLLDEAAGGDNTRFEGAAQLFASLKKAFVDLPEYVQVFPGHGAGSACGKALGALPSTTVGYEKTFAWWAPFIAGDDEQGFIDQLLDGQPDAHAYFARMKRWNREGPRVIGTRVEPREFTSVEVKMGMADGTVALIDTRSMAKVHEGTVPGALNIPLLEKAATHIGWAFDPESDNAQIVVLAPNAQVAREYSDHFIRVGVDCLAGYLTSLKDFTLEAPHLITPAQLDELLREGTPVTLLDVRNRGEHASGTIAEASQLSAGKVLFHQEELPQPAADGSLVTFCQGGVRNTVASSALRRAGHHITELVGSYAGWSAYVSGK